MSERTLAGAVVLIALLFCVTAGIGGAVVAAQPDLGSTLLQAVRDQILGSVMDKDPFVLFLKIFLNNLEACILLFLGGATFGALTVLIIAVNGVVIGGIIELVREERGILYVLAAILPHGIVEVPSFLLSGALGLMLADALKRDWREGKGAAAAAGNLARFFLRIVLPLVLLAAFIEAFITPEIINLVI
ncbi:MAG: stage II sporulation protein M [Methanomicrobiales archaeon]|nr:stage II sporulation protein M [Methanomicrobiales archaeon]